MTSLVSVSLESGILVLDKTLIRIALEGEEAEEQGQKGTQATPREPNLSSPGKLQIGSWVKVKMAWLNYTTIIWYSLI